MDKETAKLLHAAVNDPEYGWAAGVDAAVTKLKAKLKDEPKYQNCALLQYTDTEHLEK